MRIAYLINPDLGNQRTLIEILKLYDDCEIIKTDGKSFSKLKERFAVKVGEDESYLIIVKGERLDGVWKL